MRKLVITRKWKACTRCKKRKKNNAKNFSKSSHKGEKRIYLNSECVECGRERSRAWAKSHIKESHTRYLHRTNNNQASFLFQTAKARAKNRKVKFSITLEWVRKRLSVGVCEVTGVKLHLHMTDKKQGKTNPFRPSIDRRDNDIGYTPENSRIVSWWYNHTKYTWTDEFTSLMAGILSKK